MAGTVLTILLYLSHLLYIWHFSKYIYLEYMFIYVYILFRIYVYMCLYLFRILHICMCILKKLIYYNFSFASHVSLNETLYIHTVIWVKFYHCFHVTSEG